MSEGKTGTMTTGKFPPETVFQSKEYFMDREKKLKAELTALRAECDRLKEEKRELVEECIKARSLLNDEGYYLWTRENLDAVVAKHREG